MTTAQHTYPELKQKYNRQELLGQGSFGKVYLIESKVENHASSIHVTNQNSNIHNFAPQIQHNHNQKGQNSESTARYFAAKKLKQYCRKNMQGNSTMKIEFYPQVLIMQQIKHPNLMHITQIIQENRQYEVLHYLVMDLGFPIMELNRHKQLALSFQVMKQVVRQIVDGLQHLHGQGIMHRDVKPSNIYLMDDGTAKIGDFSISRPVKNTAKTEEAMVSEQSEEKTGNITTRHYRAPQIIYGSRHYDQSIDIWGLGCTLAELILHQTLFPGTSDIHQLELIFSIIGYPQQLWPEAEELPYYYLEYVNDKPPVGLKNLLPNVPEVMLDFISRCLTLNPKKRPSIKELKNHPLLAEPNPQSRQELSKISHYLYQKHLKNHFGKTGK